MPPRSACLARSAPQFRIRRFMRSPISIRADITGSIGKQPLGDATAPLQFPKVNRKAKRDSLIARPREPMPPLPPVVAIEPAPEPEVDVSLKKDETARPLRPVCAIRICDRSGREDADSRCRFALCRHPARQSDACRASKPQARKRRGFTSAPIRWRGGQRGDRAMGAGRGASGAGVARRSRYQTVGARPVVAGRRRQGWREHRQQGRGHRRRPAAAIAGRTAGARRRRVAPRPKNVSPMRFISKRAASRCAGKSPSRRS